MAMARWETGGGGNLHAHGFSVGLPGPRVGRVHADLDGEGDLPPSTRDDDVRAVLRWLWQEGGAAEWEARGPMALGVVQGQVRALLARSQTGGAGAQGGAEGSVPGTESEGEGAGSESEAGAQGVDLLAGRADDVIAALVEDGSLETSGGEAGEGADVRYRVVPAPPVSGEAAVARGRGRRGVRERRVQAVLRDFGALQPEMEHVDLQSRPEQQFSAFFGGVVSEWNP